MPTDLRPVHNDTIIHFGVLELKQTVGMGFTRIPHWFIARTAISPSPRNRLQGASPFRHNFQLDLIKLRTINFHTNNWGVSGIIIFAHPQAYFAHCVVNKMMMNVHFSILINAARCTARIICYGSLLFCSAHAQCIILSSSFHLKILLGKEYIFY